MKTRWDIVLTGGPCSGKTTALAMIEKELIARGYHVLIVPETASELINNGIRPFGDNAIDNVSFQTLLMKQQLQKEIMFSEAASLIPADKIVIIYDRGFMDNKCYMDEDEFNVVLNNVNPAFKSDFKLFERYDAVFHLVTAADGAREFYTLANNGARTETVEQAIELDKKGRDCWVGHPKFKIIDNSTDFKGKMQRLMNEIYIILGEQIPAFTERKYLIEMPNMNMLVNRRDVDIIQTYITIEKDNESRVRKVTSKGISNYYYAEKQERDFGTIKIERRIKKREYDSYIATIYSGSHAYEVDKKRSYFVFNDQYFKLDKFCFESKLALLEVEQTQVHAALNVDPTFPSFIKVIKEVTGDPAYNNRMIAVTQTIDQNYTV